jgi:hypothetical protein
MFLVGRGGGTWFLVVRKCIVPRLGGGGTDWFMCYEKMRSSWVIGKCMVPRLGRKCMVPGLLEIAWHLGLRKCGSWVVGKCIVPELRENAWLLGYHKMHGSYAWLLGWGKMNGS